MIYQGGEDLPYIGDKMEIPASSIDLIQLLKKLYPDRMDIDDTKNDKERYRLEGKVELIRLLEQNTTTSSQLKDK
jgi:hypothetical protein